VRKTLHAQMADNAMSEVAAELAGRRRREGCMGSGEEELLQTMEEQCKAVVGQYRQREKEAFNNDGTYSTAIQDVLTFSPWVRALLELLDQKIAGADELRTLQIQVERPADCKVVVTCLG